MRKTVLILFAMLLCCLVWNPGGSDGVRRAHRTAAVLSVDRSAADVWRCEREYNADLCQPRLCPVKVPTAVTPPQLRYCQTPSAQKARLLAASVRTADAVKITSSITPSILFASPRAAEHSVYRLRRLII